MIFKPMLSGRAPEDLSKLHFPVLVSPKLDGIRAIVIDGVVVSRNLKPIPNKHVQELFGRSAYEGYDGELIVGSPTDKDCFRNTYSGVMSADGKPNVKFYAFDRLPRFTGERWEERTSGIASNLTIEFVSHYLCQHADQIEYWERHWLACGYEGLMIRDPNGPYKNGRSTEREGWLLKLKRFEDSEALVLGMEEKMHNANEATINALGNTERTSHQENLVPMDTMGALIVRDLKTGVTFNIGTGFSDSDRDWWWNRSTSFTNELMNNGGVKRHFLPPTELIKYKFFPSGSKDKPRFPTYLGIRSKDDM